MASGPAVTIGAGVDPPAQASRARQPVAEPMHPPDARGVWRSRPPPDRVRWWPELRRVARGALQRAQARRKRLGRSGYERAREGPGDYVHARLRKRAMTLKDKTLFISGGSRGIGLEIALRAAHNSANVEMIAETSENRVAGFRTVFAAAEAVTTPQPRCRSSGTSRSGSRSAAAVHHDGRDASAADSTYPDDASIDALLPHQNRSAGVKQYDLMQAINASRRTFVVSQACIQNMKQDQEAPAHPRPVATDTASNQLAQDPHRLHDRQVRVGLCALGLNTEQPEGRRFATQAPLSQHTLISDSASDLPQQRRLNGAVARETQPVRGFRPRGPDRAGTVHRNTSSARTSSQRRASRTLTPTPTSPAPTPQVDLFPALRALATRVGRRSWEGRRRRRPSLA